MAPYHWKILIDILCIKVAFPKIKTFTFFSVRVFRDPIVISSPKKIMSAQKSSDALKNDSGKHLGRAMLLDLNLPQLQNLIKRDPQSYREDFLRQLRHFESSLEILFLNPTGEIAKEFCELALFLAHVSAFKSRIYC